MVHTAGAAGAGMGVRRIGSTHSSPGMGGRRVGRMSRSPSPRAHKHSQSMTNLDCSINILPPNLSLTDAVARDEARQSGFRGGGKGASSAVTGGREGSPYAPGQDGVHQRALNRNAGPNQHILSKVALQGLGFSDSGLEGRVGILSEHLVGLTERLTQSENGLAAQVRRDRREKGL